MKFTIKNKKLVKVEGEEFIEKLVIPDGVEIIGKSAFCNVETKEIIIPDSVRKIEEHAFFMNNLEKIVIPQSVSEMGEGVFWGCSKLKSVSLPNNIKEIPEKFFWCTAIEEFTMNNSLKKIGKSAFGRCKNLKKVTFNDNIDIIDEEAFIDCSSLEEVNFNLPKKRNQKTFCFYPNEIRKKAFSGCTNLKKVNFEFVEKFESCGSLKLGDYAFANCINLEWLTIFDVFFSNWPNCSLSVFGNCNKIFYSKNLPDWIELNKTKLFGLNLPTQFEISRVESFGNTYDSIIVTDGKTNAIEIYDVDDIEKLSETISIDEFKKMSDRKWYTTEMIGNVYYENVTEIISKLEGEDLKDQLQEFYFDDTVAISSEIDGFEEMSIPYGTYVNWYDDEAILNGGNGEYSTDQIVNALEIIDRYFSKIEKAIRYICDKCNQDYEEFKKNCYESNYSFNWLMYSNKEELVIISKNPERNEIRYKNYRESI